MQQYISGLSIKRKILRFNFNKLHNFFYFLPIMLLLSDLPRFSFITRIDYEQNLNKVYFYSTSSIYPMYNNICTHTLSSFPNTTLLLRWSQPIHGNWRIHPPITRPLRHVLHRKAEADSSPPLYSPIDARFDFGKVILRLRSHLVVVFHSLFLYVAPLHILPQQQ